MSLSLYDVSVATSMQVLGGVQGFLAKARGHAEENGLDLDELASSRLIDDMLGFGFQILSVVHHSLGSIEGVYSGEFRPPQGPYDLNWEAAEAKVSDSLEALGRYAEDEVNAHLDGDVTFIVGERQVPFSAQGFVLSFSHPNLYFHSATAYDLLRMRGVPLGKRDFMGPLRLRR
ncbi:MAG: DUF1993 domain-containing protein [Pseudomonadota bacterium]